MGRVAVIMPTYNERENLETMAARVRSAVPDADLLVVDGDPTVDITALAELHAVVLRGAEISPPPRG